jgi:hypothetical protein
MADINVTSGGGETSIQSDPVSSFSFDGLHEKAMAYGNDTPQAEPAEQVAEPVAEPTPEPDASSTNIDNASQAQLAQLSDDQLVELTVDGETVQVPWKEAKGGFQRQAHYTKSMQQLRQEQAAFNTERTALQQAQQEREAFATLLSNPELLQKFIAQQYPQLNVAAAQVQAAAEQVDPNDIATVGQIQAAQQELLRQQQLAQENFMQQLAEREEVLTRTIEDRQATAKLSSEINTTIGGLFKSHPYMQKLIPNAEQVLRYEVLQLRPNTPEETVEAFKTVFGGWVENYKATVAETTKQRTVEKHKLTTNNIQPPGGAPPQPTPTSFKKVNKMTGKTEVDWDALRAVALQKGK